MSDTDSDAVLGGILPDRRDRLSQAVINIEPDRHFTDGTALFIFKVLRRYYDRTGGVVPPDTFRSLIERSDYDASRKLLLVREFERLASLIISDEQFTWSIDSLRERAAERDTGTALVEAMAILETGWVDPDDRRGEQLKGADAARQHLQKRIHDIERSSQREFAPEGDMRFERKESLEEYSRRASLAAAGITPGTRSGIKAIDDFTGGIMPGELGLIASYTNVGKTHLVTQWAWNATVDQGQHVCFFTTETIREQVKRRIYARHSRLPQFGKPKGINSKDIKDGTLSKEDFEIFAAVLDDLENNPAYGKLNIVQVPSDGTLSYCAARLKEFSRDAECGLCVIDYLPLLQPEYARGNEREEFNQRLRDTKSMARTGNNGNGVPILSPWAIKQDKWQDALSKGYMTLASLSDTSEAEKVPDMIYAMIKQPDNFSQLTLQALKIRDGDFPEMREVEIDYRCSYIGDRPKVGNLTGLSRNAGIDELLALN